MRKIREENGYAVLEVILYIGIFAILSIAVIDSMITMTKSFRETSVIRQLSSGGDILERISREIRQSYSINIIEASRLKLNSKRSDGSDKTVEFILSGEDVLVIENNAPAEKLNKEGLIISGLSFTRINSAKGSAVKVFFSVRSESDKENRTKDFYNTVVLRGDYL